jgi:hypothetical protein
MVERQKKFRRNENLESLLDELNDMLTPVEDEVLRKFEAPKFPLVLLVGCARSGSTIMMQWLASTGQFSYPTNILSRFYMAPYVGARIQQMLSDPKYRFKDEFSDFGSSISFNSDLGKTTGVLSPNEFFYFWRRFFKFGEIQYLDETALDQIDTQKFCAELAAIEAVFGKPLAMKGMIINWNIPFVHRLLPHAIFIHIKRNPIYNAQSLIEAREKFLGDRSLWYSFKPVEYPALENLDPYQQVAGQVYFTNRAIEQGLNQIDSGGWMEVEYEEFCKAPEVIYQQLRKKLASHGFQLSAKYVGPNSFKSTNQIRLSKKHFDLLSNACDAVVECA